MELTKTLFWDVDYQQLNYELNSQFIISRVAQRGTLNDWKEIKSYYGLEKIKQTLISARYLDKKSLNFFRSCLKISSRYSFEPIEYYLAVLP